MTGSDALMPEATAVLELLKAKRGFDYRAYSREVLARRLAERCAAAGCGDLEEYARLLEANPEEPNRLLEALVVKVSAFFRDPFVFELLGKVVLPELIEAKLRVGDATFRAWSAGCATGEEPYSLAILLIELQKRMGLDLELSLFATDIDGGALARAGKALYPKDALANVPLAIFHKYFSREGDSFRLDPGVAGAVSFSAFDLLDRRRWAPPESVYGSFDLVLCRNVLIYLETEAREAVTARLIRATAPGGRLVLGEAEAPPPALMPHLRRITSYARVYTRKGDPSGQGVGVHDENGGGPLRRLI